MRVLFISRPTLFSTPGGDTVQIRQTAQQLELLGVQVDIRLANEKIDYSQYDLLHFFNIIRPNAISSHLRKAKLPFVISTIFVDYSEIESQQRGFFFRALSKLFGADGTDYFKTLGRFLINGESLIDYQYLYKGHRRSVELLLNQAAKLLPNSQHEFLRLKERYDFRNTYLKVPNGVSEKFIQKPRQNSKEKIVLCVGRIEFIKNQLNLIKALNNTDFQLYIVGKPAPNHISYYESCRSIASSNIHFLGYLNEDQVIEWLDRAKVHVLPSWFETTGLSTMEAAVRDCNVVITPKGDTLEYFADMAYYCEPDDPASIRNAVENALNEALSSELKELIAVEYRWNEAAKKTKEAYMQVLNKN